MLNFETEKSETLRNSLSYIDKLIQMIITDSFKKGEQKRKLSIEYYEVYKFKSKGSKTSSQTEHKIILTDATESKINKVNTFSETIMKKNKNKNLDDSIENQTTKNKTSYIYKVEKVQYKWFVSIREICNIKIIIIKWLKDKKQSIYQNESKRRILIQMIFGFLFNQKNKMYYYNHKVSLDNQKTLIEFEKTFFL